jgi:hypothetical protein
MKISEMASSRHHKGSGYIRWFTGLLTACRYRPMQTTIAKIKHPHPPSAAPQSYFAPLAYFPSPNSSLTDSPSLLIPSSILSDGAAAYVALKNNVLWLSSASA